MPHVHTAHCHSRAERLAEASVAALAILVVGLVPVLVLARSIAKR